MSKDLNKKSKTTIIGPSSDGQLIQIGVEDIKVAYIVEGLSAKDLSVKFKVTESAIEKVIAEHGLEKLRAAHIKHGLSKLQNIQLGHAEKLMDMETQFKKMRIVQLERSLEDYLAYFSIYGHFYKIHPITGEILKDTNGIPIQIKIPNVGMEIQQLKEAVSMSEGMKHLLNQIDDIIKGSPKPQISKEDDNIINMDNFDNLFQKRTDREDD